ncbi:MAG TPA: glycosyltransferase family 2 protein [Rhodanobacter sp.]
MNSILDKRTDLLPKITTIIPTYRRPALLRRAVLSALAQEGASIQVCVYDNASGDSTAEVVSALAESDSRVRYFCHEKNIGALANFQYGLENVTTPFYSFLSDDDVLLPGFYEEAVRELEEFPDAAFWCGVTPLITVDGTVYNARVADWLQVGLFSKPDGLLQMVKGSMPCWTGALFRKVTMDMVGPLNENLQGPSDIEYMLRAAVLYPIVVSKHPSALFLLNPESFSETAPLDCFWPGWKKMIEDISGAKELNENTRTVVRESMRFNARRMLFRRGAAALAKKGYVFSEEAGATLSSEFGDKHHAELLIRLSRICSRSPAAQLLYSYAYRLAEKVTVNKRIALKRRYGHFSQYL